MMYERPAHEEETPHPQRWIILVDLDAFFASVEELLDPNLAGKPIIVGGAPDGRGVVASASYAARAFGVRSAMPVAQALRLCPHAIVVHHRHGEYGRRSAAVMELLQEITPAVEQVSIDEAFLDVTGCEPLWGDVRMIGEMIQTRVAKELHLPVSLGIAATKLVAKIACDYGKPKGLVVVEHGQEAAFLAPLAIERLSGVGAVTGARLRECDILTIGDLARWSEDELIASFGDMGRSLYAWARGIDGSQVHVSRGRRSISQERTFEHDVSDQERIRHELLGMSENVASQLREKQLVAQTVRIKYRKPDFSTYTRQATCAQPTDRGQTVYREALDLLEANWHEGQPLRLLGVGVSGLLPHGGYQLELFERHDQKEIKLNQALDDIRSRYGRHAIERGSLLRRRPAGNKGKPPEEEQD